eukprot:6332154-Amphidinium_carterae.1
MSSLLKITAWTTLYVEPPYLDLLPSKNQLAKGRTLTKATSFMKDSPFYKRHALALDIYPLPLYPPLVAEQPPFDRQTAQMKHLHEE